VQHIAVSLDPIPYQSGRVLLTVPPSIRRVQR
jgi:hypothetical protein